MEHVTFLYRLVFFVLGFFNTAYVIFLYARLKRPVYLALLLIWLALTVVAAGYAAEYYVLDLFRGLASRKYVNISLGASCWFVFLVPWFTLSALNIRNKALLVLLFSLSGLLFIGSLFPLTEQQHLVYRIGVMSLVAVAQVSSFVLILVRVEATNRFTRNVRILAWAYLGFLPVLMVVDFLHIHTFVPSFSQDFRLFPVLYLAGAVCTVFLTWPELSRQGIGPVEMSEQALRRIGLSKKEREVAQCLIQGLPYKRIAADLFISVNTVNTHVKNIYQKTGCHNKLELSRMVKASR